MIRGSAEWLGMRLWCIREAEIRSALTGKNVTADDVERELESLGLLADEHADAIPGDPRPRPAGPGGPPGEPRRRGG
jgi:hypothetical protein